MKLLTHFCSFLTICLVAFPSHIRAQINTGRGYANVDKRLGYEVYFLAEPVRRYEKLFTVDVSSFSVNVPDKEDLSNDRTKLGKLSRRMTITDKISHFATMVQQEDEAWEVDAVIYTGGQVATAIKFTDPGQIEGMGVAKVWNESGIDLYVLSTPRYSRLKKKKKWAYDGLRNKGGLFKKPLEFITEDTSIETDIYQLLRLVAKGNPKKWPDGLIINASGLIQGFDYR